MYKKVQEIVFIDFYFNRGISTHTCANEHRTTLHNNDRQFRVRTDSPT